MQAVTAAPSEAIVITPETTLAAAAAAADAAAATSQRHQHYYVQQARMCAYPDDPSRQLQPSLTTILCTAEA